MAKSRGYGSGGARTGTPGKSYSNRTDLNQPVKTAPGQAYGQASAQATSQAAVPLPNNAGQLAAMTQSAQQTQQQQAPVAGESPQQPSAAPGDLGAFNRPSENPNQPVTHGSPSGPGAGPEALGPTPGPNIAQTIAQIAQSTGNQSLMALAQRAQSQALAGGQSAH